MVNEDSTRSAREAPEPNNEIAQAIRRISDALATFDSYIRFGEDLDQVCVDSLARAKAALETLVKLAARPSASSEDAPAQIDTAFAEVYPTLSALASRYGTVKGELLSLLESRTSGDRYIRQHSAQPAAADARDGGEDAAFEDALLAFEDAAYDCGAWTGADDEDDYETFSKRLGEARENLRRLFASRSSADVENAKASLARLERVRDAAARVGPDGGR